MNPNLQSTKFQLSALVALIGVLSPFIAGVPPTIALVVVAAVVVAYMYFNSIDEKM